MSANYETQLILDLVLTCLRKSNSAKYLDADSDPVLSLIQDLHSRLCEPEQELLRKTDDAEVPSSYAVGHGNTTQAGLDALVKSLQNDVDAGIFEGDLLEVKLDLRSHYDVNEWEVPDFLQSFGNLMLWKDAQTGDARMRWMLVYSNNIVDGSGDIFTRKCQRAYEYLVNEGVVPQPEAWLWHLPGTTWGVADAIMTVDTDEQTTFTVACGTVLPGSEWVAQGLRKMNDLEVSLGTPLFSVLRDPTMPKAIDFCLVNELSVLPKNRADNPFTMTLVV